MVGKTTGLKGTFRETSVTQKDTAGLARGMQLIIKSCGTIIGDTIRGLMLRGCMRVARVTK